MIDILSNKQYHAYVKQLSGTMKELEKSHTLMVQ
jgi:hypothetical protein